MTSCIASGFRRSASREESTMSQKSTVTCLRSPSRAAFEVRIFSARCLGVYDSGEGLRGAAAGSPVTGVPHLLQNREPAGSSVVQVEQVRLSRAPQPRQKFDPGGFSCWHRKQVVPEPPHGYPPGSTAWNETSV